MNTPPIPYPGDALAEMHPDGGWQVRDGTNLRALPRRKRTDGSWCAAMGQAPYAPWLCVEPSAEPHSWHIATVDSHVCAVWPDPYDQWAADLCAEAEATP